MSWRLGWASEGATGKKKRETQGPGPELRPLVAVFAAELFKQHPNMSVQCPRPPRETKHLPWACTLSMLL